MVNDDPRLEALKREYKRKIKAILEEHNEPVDEYEIESLMESNNMRKQLQEVRRYVEEGRRALNEVRLWGKTLGVFGRR